MHLDARTEFDSSVLETDICIVGAGVAGTALAHALIDQPFRVLVLESGGTEEELDIQELSEGENTGRDYFSLSEVSVRGLGGSSRHWVHEIGPNTFGAQMRPLDAIDFDEREEIPYSGWPISKHDLLPFYRRAQSFIKAGPFAYEADEWPDAEGFSHFTRNDIPMAVIQFASRDIFMSDRQEELKQSENVTVLTHATALEVKANENARSVTGVRATCEGELDIDVRAKFVVLAAGGFGTPRLLLLSDRVQSAGLGNQNDLVGRFFMEHLHVTSGYFVPADPSLDYSIACTGPSWVDGFPVRGCWTLPDEVVRREKLPRYCTGLSPGSPFWRREISSGYKSLKEVATSVSQGEVPGNIARHVANISADVGHITQIMRDEVKRRVSGAKAVESDHLSYHLVQMSEQVPNPDSRVTLSSNRDRLGQRRLQLNWQLSDQDIDCIIQSQRHLDRLLVRNGLGRIYAQHNRETLEDLVEGGYHLMGTTRMHEDPNQGVVNEHSQVHGLRNLFIAGPSVFPTSGFANPTMTIVALSVRLAEHLKAVMKEEDL